MMFAQEHRRLYLAIGGPEASHASIDTGSEQSEITEKSLGEQAKDLTEKGVQVTKDFLKTFTEDLKTRWDSKPPRMKYEPQLLVWARKGADVVVGDPLRTLGVSASELLTGFTEEEVQKGEMLAKDYLAGRITGEEVTQSLFGDRMKDGVMFGAAGIVAERGAKFMGRGFGVLTKIPGVSSLIDDVSEYVGRKVDDAQELVDILDSWVREGDVGKKRAINYLDSAGVNKREFTEARAEIKKGNVVQDDRLDVNQKPKTVKEIKRQKQLDKAIKTGDVRPESFDLSNESMVPLFTRHVRMVEENWENFSVQDMKDLKKRDIKLFRSRINNHMEAFSQMVENLVKVPEVYQRFGDDILWQYGRKLDVVFQKLNQRQYSERLHRVRVILQNKIINTDGR